MYFVAVINVIVIFLLFVHLKINPTKDYFAVAEKGKCPYILLYEYPLLRIYRILKGKQDTLLDLLYIRIFIFFLYLLSV